LPKPTRHTFQLYRHLLREARPYWGQILLLAGVNLLRTPLALLTPVPLKIAVDSIAGSAPLPYLYTTVLPSNAGITSLAVITAVLMVAVAALVKAQAVAVRLLETHTGERLVLDFRARLFAHMQRLSLAYHDSNGTVDSLYRLQYDAPAIQSIAVNGVMPFVSAVLTLVAMLYVIARIDTTLAIVAFAAAPLLFWTTRTSVARLKEMYKAVKNLERDAMSVPHEVLSSIRMVKACVREDYEKQRFIEASRVRNVELQRLTVVQVKFDMTIALLIAATNALTLSLGIMHVREGWLTLGNLLLVIGYLGQFYSPLTTMTAQTNHLQAAIAGAERAIAVLDEPEDVFDRPGARSVARAAGDVEFRGVTFAYGAEPPVLHDVSFAIPAGASVGIAGVTGAGKTTLMSLLTRFYDPTAGAVLLDGVDMRDIRLRDLRTQFAVVHQEPVLFPTSVVNNILYARPDATREEVEEAARAANAHDFIHRLPDRYDTNVGERGIRLSGGERQRIALARAFLKDAAILLLDEPTSAVDVKTEEIIMEALSRLMQGRTTFMIAHRLSTLERCDIRMTIERGRVVSVLVGGQRMTTRPSGPLPILRGLETVATGQGERT
jgi:ATP-binding cassette subfamily B protein